MSLCRQNFHEETEAGINRFINLKLFASYTYRSLQGYFERDDVALRGAQEYFAKLSHCKQEQVDLLNEYQNKRGGRISFQEVQKPAKDNWGTPIQAMEEALNLEKRINQEALNMYQLAKKHGDEHLEDFIEDNFLESEVVSIKQLSDNLTNMKRVGSGLGAYLFDKESLK